VEGGGGGGWGGGRGGGWGGEISWMLIIAVVLLGVIAYLFKNLCLNIQIAVY